MVKRMFRLCFIFLGDFEKLALFFIYCHTYERKIVHSTTPCSFNDCSVCTDSSCSLLILIICIFSFYLRQSFEKFLFFKKFIYFNRRLITLSFQSQRKAMPKNAQTTTQLHSFHTLVK